MLREKYDRVSANRAHAQCLHMIEPVCIRAKSQEGSAHWAGAEKLNLDCCLPAGVPNVYVLRAYPKTARSTAILAVP